MQALSAPALLCMMQATSDASDASDASGASGASDKSDKSDESDKSDHLLLLPPLTPSSYSLLLLPPRDTRDYLRAQGRSQACALAFPPPGAARGRGA